MPRRSELNSTSEREQLEVNDGGSSGFIKERGSERMNEMDAGESTSRTTLADITEISRNLKKPDLLAKKG